MLYLSQNGIGLYDGNTLRLLSRDALYETMRMRMEGMDGAARACVCNHIYYLAMCIKESESDVLSENNTVLEYDTERGTFMVRKGMRVKDFFAVGGKVYFTQADAPYEVLSYGDPESGGYLGAPMECLWETPWLDLGKAYMKRDFVLRFTADADENDVPVEMTIKTERREKTRVVLLQRQRKDYRVKIQVSGGRMKLKIRSHAKAAGWRIYGGVQAEYSLDEVSMAFKQPRVPQETGGTLAAYVRNLTMFLRDFCMASWNADRLKDAEIEKIKKRLDALEGK